MDKYTSDGHLPHIAAVAQEDADGLIRAHKSYGDSWKKRGGIGAYMVMIRKFDRMENGAAKHGFDIVKAVKEDPRAEGILDDIRDARRYLMLIEAWLRELGLVEAGNHRDNVVVNFGGPLPPGTRQFVAHTGKAANVLSKQAESRLHRRGEPVEQTENLRALERSRRIQHLKVCVGCDDPAHGKPFRPHRHDDPSCNCSVCSGEVGPPSPPPAWPKGGPIDPTQVFLAGETAKDREDAMFTHVMEQQNYPKPCGCRKCAAHPKGCGCGECVAAEYQQEAAQVKIDEPLGGCDEG